MCASTRGLIAVAAVAGLVVGVLPAAAHGNYVAADAQVSDDGTVRIELVVAVTDAFVVLHAGGSGGPVIGHRAVGDGFVRPGMTVRIDPGHWANTTGSRTVAAVLHHDSDGNGRFDPSADPPLEGAGSGEPVASRFAVRNGSGRVNVLAERERAQTTNASRVLIRRVRTAVPGYLVVRADANGSSGRIVGREPIGAGIHRNVTVRLDEGFYRDRPERFPLWAVVHRGDGDGSFEAGADAAVEAGGSPVMSRFSVRRTGNLSGSHGHGTANAGGTAAPEHGDGTDGRDGADAGTHGHGGTGTDGHGTGVSPTSSPTPEPAPAPALTSASTATAPVRTGTSPASTSARTPGFGVAVALAALALAVLLAVRRS